MPADGQEVSPATGREHIPDGVPTEGFEPAKPCRCRWNATRPVSF
jgi:hypothetical protein